MMMNSFGLPEDVLGEIILSLSKFPEINSAKIFGSRAKGNYKRYSDVDIAIFADADKDISQDVMADLDDLYVIYHFDVIHYEKTSAAEIKAHIDRVGIEFYAK